MLDDDSGQIKAIIALYRVVATNIVFDAIAKVTLFRNTAIVDAIVVLGKEGDDRSYQFMRQ